MHPGVLAVTVVEKTIVCTADLLGKTSGGCLAANALRETLTVKINNSKYIPQFSQLLIAF